ncbi:uncharacterized protein [Macrobrachium rosenbergii]|uniref:uncharacterized protein n=1 Tax=Macrobrachium rosenbergii TaxID=79674 RepID=UPI0034D671C8
MWDNYLTVEQLLDEAKMPLRGWVSNSLAFDQWVGVEEPTEISVLGMLWHRSSDQMCLKPFKGVGELPSNWVPTKCRVLSLLVSNFDPLGLVSPTYVRGKLFLQKLWEEGTGWDDVLDTEKQTETMKILEEFVNMRKLKFKRGILTGESEIHVFTDASSKAYGAAAYAKGSKGETNLLTSKMRVTPRKQQWLTILKLELLALLLGIRLGRSLKNLIKVSTVVIWTDSKIAIAWVNSKEENRNVFIANRVGQANSLLQECGMILKHVPMKSNPADLLSQGTNMRELTDNQLWHRGPQFLHVEGPADPPQLLDEASLSQANKQLVAALHELQEEVAMIQLADIWPIMERMLQECWCPGSRCLAKEVVGGCVACIKSFKPSLHRPPPPLLPIARTQMSQPFACIGLDHTGPIQVGGGIGYILLVTCMNSRAIYLD